jgi:hypothetical protein
VPRTLAVELAEALDVVNLHRKFPQDFILRVDGFHTAKMEEPIQQHGSVTSR